MRRISTSLVLAALMLLAACGTPTRTNGTLSTASSSGESASVATSPMTTTQERPRSFDLSSVDPCSLITPEQQAQLDATQPPISTTTSASMPECSFGSLADYSYGVFIDLTASAESVVADSTGTSLGTATVNGFVVPLLGVDGVSACSGFVDTAEGQYLSVQANSLDQRPPSELCDAVQPALKMVLDNLAALQP